MSAHPPPCLHPVERIVAGRFAVEDDELIFAVDFGPAARRQKAPATQKGCVASEGSSGSLKVNLPLGPTDIPKAKPQVPTA